MSKRAVHVWRFMVWVIWDHQHDKSPFRFFKTEAAARAWVKKEHESRWDDDKDQFKMTEQWESLGFETADLFKILPSGEVEGVDQYQTYADSDGVALGWVGADA